MVEFTALFKGKLFYIFAIGFVATVSVVTVVTVVIIDGLQKTPLVPDTTIPPLTSQTPSTIDSGEGSGDDGSGEENFMGSLLLSKFLSVNSFTNGEEISDHENLVSEGFMRIK